MPDNFLRAEIIAVGSELLDAPRAETNSLFLGDRLGTVGARVFRKWVVGDREKEISEALGTALSASSDVIILTGGLGPTNDDVTRDVVAASLSLKLWRDAALVDKLDRHARRLKLRLSQNNLRQADVPEGATVIPNPRGTAPGLCIEHANSLIFLLPGPPRELNPMVDAEVLAMIRRRKPGPEFYSRILKVAALAESRVDALIEDDYKSFPKIETTVLSSVGIIDVRFNWIGEPDRETANRQLDDLTHRARNKLGHAVYATEDKTLEAEVGELCRSRGLTVSTAESCTGGLLGKLLTDTAGSSSYYRGGVVTYSNALKCALLGVNEITLQRFGAVSREVAEQMAVGIRERSASDYGLSTTGIAGPEGGSDAKPVGLVYVGLSWREGNRVVRLQLPGDRHLVRLRSARIALDQLRKHLRKATPSDEAPTNRSKD